MGSIGQWVLGGVISILAIIALFFAAHAKDAAIHYTGLLIFVACVLFVMYQIKSAFDSQEGGGGH